MEARHRPEGRFANDAVAQGASREARRLRTAAPRRRWRDRLETRGVPLLVIGQAVGHVDPATTSKYAHIADKAAQNAQEMFGSNGHAAHAVKANRPLMASGKHRRELVRRARLLRSIRALEDEARSIALWLELYQARLKPHEEDEIRGSVVHSLRYKQLLQEIYRLKTSMTNIRETISKYEQVALDAIAGGRSMGQMLRELPASTPKKELQKYSRAYDALRR